MKSISLQHIFIAGLSILMSCHFNEKKQRNIGDFPEKKDHIPLAIEYHDFIFDTTFKNPLPPIESSKDTLKINLNEYDPKILRSLFRHP